MIVFYDKRIYLLYSIFASFLQLFFYYKGKRKSKKQKNSWKEPNTDHTNEINKNNVFFSSKPLPPVAPGEVKRRQTGNYDSMMSFCDQEAIAECLKQANIFRDNLTTWCLFEDNFVAFAHFWLEEICIDRRAELFQMEYVIVLEYMEESFSAGRASSQISREDLTGFLSMVLREYPDSLFGKKVLCFKIIFGK